MDDWEIQFEKSLGAINTVKVEYEDFPENIDRDLKSTFIKFLKKLPLLKAGDINIDVFETTKSNDNSISVVFIIRNGCDEILKLEKLPIVVKDEQGEVVASGVFNIESANPHKAKIHEIVITEDYILKKDYDINNCKVAFQAL